MFRRIERMVAQCMPEGYSFLPEPNAVAAAVLGGHRRQQLGEGDQPVADAHAVALQHRIPFTSQKEIAEFGGGIRRNAPGDSAISFPE